MTNERKDDKDLVYFLTGKMTGEPNNGFPVFNHFAKVLRNYGYTVLNPAEMGIVNGWEWEDYMRRALQQMLMADVVLCLPKAIDSGGSRFEQDVARKLSMPIHDACVFLQLRGIDPFTYEKY